MIVICCERARLDRTRERTEHWPPPASGAAAETFVIMQPAWKNSQTTAATTTEIISQDEADARWGGIWIRAMELKLRLQLAVCVPLAMRSSSSLSSPSSSSSLSHTSSVNKARNVQKRGRPQNDMWYPPKKLPLQALCCCMLQNLAALSLNKYN